MRQLRKYFQQTNTPDWLLWQRIASLVVLTLLSHVAQIPPTVNCFEFFGFDVLIDSCLRPWLLEVNLSPALGNDCDADRSVKKPMLHDMFDLLGLPLYNTGLSVFTVWLDDLKENDTVEQGENASFCKQAKPAVVTAAERWRKKQRKMSAKYRSQAVCQKKIISSIAIILSQLKSSCFFFLISEKHFVKSNDCQLQHSKNVSVIISLIHTD